jgi:hypothetical protein
MTKFPSFIYEVCCYSFPPAGSRVRTFAALVDVVASGQFRQTLACRLLVSGADSAVKTTFVGLIAFVTYLLVTTLNCGCRNIKIFV